MPDARLTNDAGESEHPKIAVRGDELHLVWRDDRDGNYEVYYNRSTDDGATWLPSDTRISHDPSYSIRTNAVVSRDAVHLFWRDNRDGNFEEYVRQSRDGGLSWGPETRLTEAPDVSGCPFPVVSGDTLNLFWRDNRSGNFQIYHKRSVDAGATWGPDTILTPEGIKAEFPYPAVWGETIHLVWRDNRDGNAEIYYKRSIDGGINAWKAAGFSVE